MKCAVKDCANHSDEGLFVGFLCNPCHTFIKGDGGLYSQAYRNLRIMIDLAIAAEREACAKVCDTEWNGDSDTYEYANASNECAEAIRARRNT